MQILITRTVGTRSYLHFSKWFIENLRDSTFGLDLDLDDLWVCRIRKILEPNFDLRLDSYVSRLGLWDFRDECWLLIFSLLLDLVSTCRHTMYNVFVSRAQSQYEKERSTKLASSKYNSLFFTRRTDSPVCSNI